VATEALRPVTFYHDWFPGDQFAGVYVALDRGYCCEAGLDVLPGPFACDQETMRLVGDDLAPLLRGELAAMQGFATEEFVKNSPATKPASFSSPNSASIPDPNSSTPPAPKSARHRDALRRVIAATRRGWITALAEPAVALTAIRPRLDPSAYDEAFPRACLTALRDTVSPAGRVPLASARRRQARPPRSRLRRHRPDHGRRVGRKLCHRSGAPPSRSRVPRFWWRCDP
jgi:hypothetical protein